MTVVALRPSGIDVVAALAEAARLLRGADTLPLDELHRRARLHAAAAFSEAAPHLGWARIAELIDGPAPLALPRKRANALSGAVRDAHRASWWRDNVVEQIIGLLTAGQYGEQAQ